MRPVLPYIVVDQNRLRDDELIPRLLDRAKNLGELVVVTDTAILEMAKSDKWEYSTKRSLNALSAYPEGVVVSHGIGALMRAEMGSGEPQPDVVDHQLTPRIRELLLEIRAGAGPSLAAMQMTVPHCVDMAREHQLNHQRNRKYVLGLRSALEQELPAETLKRLRNRDESAWPEALADLEMTKKCFIALKGSGYSELAASHLSFTASVSSHAFLGMAAVALRWLADGGAESAKVETLTNDLLDMDYIVIATFCKGIESAEGRVLDMYRRMSAVMDKRWEVLRDVYVAAESKSTTGDE